MKTFLLLKRSFEEIDAALEAEEKNRTKIKRICLIIFLMLK